MEPQHIPYPELGWPYPLGAPFITIKGLHAPQSSADNGRMAFVRLSIFIHSIPLAFFLFYLFISLAACPPSNEAFEQK